MTGGTAGRVADAAGNWVDRLAPARIRPFLRLARLIARSDRGCCCCHAGGRRGSPRCRRDEPVPNPWHVLLFFIGAFAMRGAGCTWNDITDRDLDALVERTRSRPIPAGQVSVPQAAGFLVLQALVGLVVLLQFNRFAIGVGIASLVIVAIYPFMKRITYWPQIVLGLAFSWGALMGWAAAFGSLDRPALVLYAGADRLGDRLRHDLRPPGSRGRRADRREIDRAPVRAADAAHARGLLRGGGRPDRIGGLSGGRRAGLRSRACRLSPATSPGRSSASTSTTRRCASSCSSPIATPG